MHDPASLNMSSAPSDILRMNAQNGRMQMAGGMDDMNFEEAFLSNMNGIPSLPFTPSFELSDNFVNTFDDPFSYQLGEDFSNILEDTKETVQNDPVTTGASPDNKLLGFGNPVMKAPMLDNIGQTWPSMSAELYGMFFVAEDVFGDNMAHGRPTELTCYRRNLFQISGTFALSRGTKSMINEQGHQIPFYNLTATLTATESIEGKSTEIISVPWKTSPGASSEDKAGTAPVPIQLDLSMNPELDASVVSIPVAWKRLQFKHATANNGRRKGLQQHYVVRVSLVATLATGDSVKLAEIQSGAIIVRGRSPRNFDSRKDIPVSEKKTEPKQRTTSEGRLSAPQVKGDPGVNHSSTQFYGINALPQPLDLPDWPKHTIAATTSSASDLRPHPSKKPNTARQHPPSIGRPPVPRTDWNSAGTLSKTALATTPIDLSLADDQFSRGHSDSLGSSCKPRNSTSPVLDRFKIAKRGVGSPIEDADLLYEYFPLSLDDWMPPVDAVYRPHVVHHTPDFKAQQGKNKPKRYFTA